MSCRGLLLPWALVGCLYEAPQATFEGPPPLTSPRLQSMQSSAIRVGETLAFSGDRFIEARWGRVEVTFTGTFMHAGGMIDATATQLAERMDDGWIETTFGPFAVPFLQNGNAT